MSGSPNALSPVGAPDGQPPGGQSDEDLAIEILRKLSVQVHPGHFYDFSGEGHLIVSLITPPRAFHKGIAQVLGLLNQ